MLACGGDFDSRYSQRGVQWAVNRIAMYAGITKEVSVHTFRHTYARHLLEDGMNIVTLKELMGHANIEATMEYLHCIVPGGGIDKGGKWQKQIRSNKYLFSVKALSKVFRAKYVQQLKERGIADKPLLESLFGKDWVVYAKRPFGGPKRVTEYLGRYTHYLSRLCGKVAISNLRLLEVTDTDISFLYKDYSEQGRRKIMQLSNRGFGEVCSLR